MKPGEEKGENNDSEPIRYTYTCRHEANGVTANLIFG